MVTNKKVIKDTVRSAMRFAMISIGGAIERLNCTTRKDPIKYFIKDQK